MVDKFKIQESQYEFPYHYLPHIDKAGVPRVSRQMAWGLEYLTYTAVVREIVESLPGDSILDIGCGDGYLLNSINREFEVAKGIDLAPRPIGFANAFARGATFAVEDLFTLSASFDIVTLIEVMEHIPDDLISRFMEQAKSLVDEGGHLVVSVPTTVYPLNAKHYRHYDEETLRAHFGLMDDWTMVESRRIYRVSKRLKAALRVMNNKAWMIRSEAAWRALWTWHTRRNVEATTEDGAHIVAVFRRN